MATVVEVGTSKPTVKEITIKLTRGEATDMKLFVEEWYRRQSFPAGAKSHSVHKALTAALDGKSTAPTYEMAASF